MIEQGRAALNAGDVATARTAFEQSLAEAESGPAREGLGQAYYLLRTTPAQSLSMRGHMPRTAERAKHTQRHSLL